MNAPPEFATFEEFRSRLSDVDFWWPHVCGILQRHDLLGSGREPVAGFNATYPTFICGDVVVKLFGYLDASRSSFRYERAAQARIASDPEIAAPRLLTSGDLDDGSDSPWSYLITSCVPGVVSWRADLSADQRRSITAELGRQVQRLHSLRPTGVARHEDWATVDVTTAAARSSLPPHLVAQVEGYVARLGTFDRVLVNGDIVANHVYVEDGRLSGIIDWGDALATDRHVELIQIYRDMCSCDNGLFRVFLEASDWPVDRDFAHKALGYALYRQALGLAQHPSIDVFEPIAEKYPLQDIATLDELAEELFGV